MIIKRLIMAATLMGIVTVASGQYKTGSVPVEVKTDTSAVVITLEDA